MTVTSWLDLVGLLLVVAGVGLALAAVSVPLGVCVTGALVLAASWLIDRQRGRKAAP